MNCTGHFTLDALTSRPVACKVWGEITYPFPNFNRATTEVWEWISNFIPHFNYPCWDQSQFMLVKGAPRLHDCFHKTSLRIRSEIFMFLLYLYDIFYWNLDSSSTERHAAYQHNTNIQVPVSRLSFHDTVTLQWRHNERDGVSQITGVSIVYSTVCSGADQRKHQSFASLAFVRGLHRWSVNSPHKGPVKCFH